MKLFAIKTPGVLQLALCSLLAGALVWPMAAQAAKGKVAPSKTASAKGSDRKRAVTAKRSVASKKVAHNKRSTSSRREAVAKASQSKQASRVSRAHRRNDQRVARNASSPAKQRVSSRRGAGHSVVASSRAKSSFVRVAMTRPASKGERLGLRDSDDALDLNSSVALVVDQLTGEVLYSKNDSAVLPIASLTKLMTGLVLADANLPMDEMITITRDDVDTVKNSRSRLAVGTTASRGELMHLALMSSENRAAHALGRTYPGGLTHFVRLMNAKARELGMTDTHYVDPTGLMSQNQSSARDLVTLVNAAYERPILRDLSTSPSHEFAAGSRTLQYNNSNRLIRNPEWDIGLQKTGYISEAGRCLVMQANVAGRSLVMVFLDASGRSGRVQDAERVRHWVEAQGSRRSEMRPQG
jgi:serine-type D-Ala-D-Ala endopeptidase (penicillin-binding protein 7)